MSHTTDPPPALSALLGDKHFLKNYIILLFNIFLPTEYISVQVYGPGAWNSFKLFRSGSSPNTTSTGIFMKVREGGEGEGE